MKQSYKFAAVAALGLGIAVGTAYAHPGQMGGGMEQGKSGMQHGKGGMGHGGMGGGAQHGAGQQLMTPEERTALREKMRNATPEQRQQIAAATHAEMHKRAEAKGITLPEGRGPHRGATSQAPATTEHQH